MMSLTNLGLTPDPLVSNLFAIFLCVLTIMLLVFWVLTFLHRQESIPKVVESLDSFGDQIPGFPSKFHNKFYSYSLSFCSHRLQLL